MHKVILTLLALLFGVTGCSFTLSTYGGAGADGPMPLVASHGPGAQFSRDRVRHGFGKPARRVDADRPATHAGGVAPVKPKQPAITWAGKVPEKPKKPAKKPPRTPAITWAGTVPPIPQ